MKKLKKPKWRLFIYKYDNFLWIPEYRHTNLLWKDKYNTPRIEFLPKYNLMFGYWCITLIQGNDQEWEQYIWITEYNNNDYQKAKDSWSWIDKNNKSTWIDYNF